MRTRSRPGADIAIAARSITVCHLGNIAYELGRPVQWDPAQERFVNDPDADRLFARRCAVPGSSKQGMRQPLGNALLLLNGSNAQGTPASGDRKDGKKSTEGATDATK